MYKGNFLVTCPPCCCSKVCCPCYTDLILKSYYSRRTPCAVLTGFPLPGSMLQKELHGSAFSRKIFPGLGKSRVQAQCFAAAPLTMCKSRPQHSVLAHAEQGWLAPKIQWQVFKERKRNFAWPLSYYAVTKL